MFSPPRIISSCRDREYSRGGLPHHRCRLYSQPSVSNARAVVWDRCRGRSSPCSHAQFPSSHGWSFSTHWPIIFTSAFGAALPMVDVRCSRVSPGACVITGTLRSVRNDTDILTVHPVFMPLSSSTGQGAPSIIALRRLPNRNEKLDAVARDKHGSAHLPSPLPSRPRLPVYSKRSKRVEGEYRRSTRHAVHGCARIPAMVKRERNTCGRARHLHANADDVGVVHEITVRENHTLGDPVVPEVYCMLVDHFTELVRLQPLASIASHSVVPRHDAPASAPATARRRGSVGRRRVRRDDAGTTRAFASAGE